MGENPKNIKDKEKEISKASNCPHISLFFNYRLNDTGPNHLIKHIQN